MNQTIKKVLKLLDVNYGQTRTEEVEDCVKDLLKFREDQYDEDNELILAIKEMNQRRKELNMSQDEWYTVGMLGCMRKRKIVDNFKFRAHRDVIKEGGADVVNNFEKKYENIRVEGKRKSVPATMYAKSVPNQLMRTHYTESEIKTRYMGTESEAQK